MRAGCWIDLLSTNPGIAFEPRDGDKGLTQRRQRVAKILAASGKAVSQLASQQAAESPSESPSERHRARIVKAKATESCSENNHFFDCS